MLKRISKIWCSLGPGLITGAADDDGSGILTYSIAGARFGPANLWILFYILPFMIAIQEMCARIGALSGCGLAGNIKRYYPVWLLVPAALALIIANVFGIGADIYGMAGAMNLLFPLDVRVMAVIMSAVIIVMVITLRYRQIESIFKWLAMSLGVYVVALVVVQPDWMSLLWHTLIPTIRPDRNLLLVSFAMLGTTISPYLFFWQASQEAEDIRQDRPQLRICKYRTVHRGVLANVDWDTRIGMIVSNIVAFGIIGLTATVLYSNGVRDVVTLRDAAEALRPLAGQYAFILFAAGLIGSGLLAIPILAGSAAYVVAELMGWTASLDKPFNRARQFYLVMVAAVAFGMILPFFGVTPVQALYWAAIVNGLVAPPLIMLIIHMSNNPAIVGPHRSRGIVHFLGIATVFFLLTGAIYVIIS
ncbi:MAG TPA: divalent metal cation transporter [Candidatus Paceibacterota bacterium]|nr:divalent metal cation transporter [Candidatus Paceibacterota bacterium]